MSDQKNEYPFSHIKPHKVGDYMGFPSVLEIVSKEVRHILDLLDMPGAYIHILDLFNFAELVLPGLKPMRIEQRYIISILEWCKRDDTVFIGENISCYKLAYGAIKHIKTYS